MKINRTFFLTIISLAVIICSPRPLLAQFVQKGADLDGEAADDQSGYSVSMPNDSAVAIGAWLNNGNGTWSGHVRAYEWGGTSWVQKGADMDGESLGDESGFSVSMPDDSTVAIGAIKNDGGGSDAGHVRVYAWNGTSWVQKGNDIDGEAASDWLGYALSMPDANTLAVGAIQNDGGGSNAGHVRVYEWNGVTWTQKGSDLDGEASGDESGEAVSMPDANTVAVGAHKNDGNGTDAGHVRIYAWNGTSWLQKGADLDGESTNDNSGTAVSMPDANTVAIGALNNDGGGNNAGHVRVFDWNGTAWVQRGSDINGEAANDQSGWSVSMPSANVVVVGGVNNDGNGSNSGHVRIYGWNGVAWVQTNTDIDGEAANDKSGWSVSMPDTNTLAIGAIWNDGNGSNSGHVRVYAFTCNSSATINPVACDSFTVPSGNETHTTSGIFSDTIANAAGCDSVITINLTINYSNTGTDAITACDSLTWIDGNTYFANNNTATHTLTNAAGCDSVVTLDLTVNHSNTGTDAITACDSFTWIDGNTYVASNNTATHTLTNASGCDSVVTLALTINHSNTGTDMITACDSFTWIDGNTYVASNNTATHTLTNAAGCDSVVTLDLTINYSNTATDVITACDSFTWIDGNTYIVSNNTAMHTLTNAAGCDSVVALDLSIHTVDNSVSVIDETLTANAASAVYQWVDCEKDYAVIPNETAQTFTATASGEYAVVITQNGCTDTSDCFTLNIVGVEPFASNSAIKLYPNPTFGLVTIDIGEGYNNAWVRVMNAAGEIIQSIDFVSSEQIQFELNQAAGLYTVNVYTEKGYRAFRVLKVD